MSTMVVGKIDLPVVANNNVRPNNDNATDSNFNEILNRQTDNRAKKDIAERPVTNVKASNNNQHRVRDAKNLAQDEAEAKVDDVQEIEAEIVNQVTEKLDITEEQLNEMLAQLDMTVFDLLLPDKLNTFLMTLYNVEDSLELLAIPNAASDIKELKGELSELMKEYDLEAEDISDIIAKLDNDQLTEISTTVSEEKDTNEQQQSSDNKNQSPEISITDNRTVKGTDDTMSEDSNKKSNTLSVSDDSNNGDKNIIGDKAEEIKAVEEKAPIDIASSNKEAVGNLQNVSINQNIQKVEIVDQSGEKHILTYNINTEEVIDQIVSSFKVNLADDVNKMYIQLRPEHLGRLALSVITQEGVVTASFMAENPAVKELIEANLANLKMSMQEQGIVVDKMEVVVNDNSMFNENNNSNQFNNNNNKKRRAARMMKLSALDEEEVIEELLNDNEDISSNIEKNNSVDYSV